MQQPTIGISLTIYFGNPNMLSYKGFLEPNCGFQPILAASPDQSGSGAGRLILKKTKKNTNTNKKTKTKTKTSAKTKTHGHDPPMSCSGPWSKWKYVDEEKGWKVWLSDKLVIGRVGGAKCGPIRAGRGRVLFIGVIFYIIALSSPVCGRLFIWLHLTRGTGAETMRT